MSRLAPIPEEGEEGEDEGEEEYLLDPWTVFDVDDSTLKAVSSLLQ